MRYQTCTTARHSSICSWTIPASYTSTNIWCWNSTRSRKYNPKTLNDNFHSLLLFPILLKSSFPPPPHSSPSSTIVINLVKKMFMRNCTIIYDYLVSIIIRIMLYIQSSSPSRLQDKKEHKFDDFDFCIVSFFVLLVVETNMNISQPHTRARNIHQWIELLFFGTAKKKLMRRAKHFYSIHKKSFIHEKKLITPSTNCNYQL